MTSRLLGAFGQTRVVAIRTRWRAFASAILSQVFEDELADLKSGGYYLGGIDENRWHSSLFVIWRSAAQDAVRQARLQLASIKQFQDVELISEIPELTRLSGQRAVSIVESTRMVLLDKSEDEIDALYELWGTGRAETIAETETNAAVAWGSHHAARDYYNVRRVWRTMGDSFVRETHQAAEGQTVPLDQPFVVGGALLNYPNDPSGPASETINCRCWEDYLRVS